MVKSVPLVRHVMQPSVEAISPDMDAFEAIDRILARKHGFGGLPVVNAGGRLVGFLTMKDCLRLQVLAHHHNVTGCTVRDIMSGINNSLHPEMDILTAATVFLNCNFLLLPVIEEKALIGSVARRDLVLAIQAWYRERGFVMQNEKTMLSLVDAPTSIAQLQALVGISNNAQLASVLGGRHNGGLP
jgi:CBS-domain-containing membrane protein